MRRSSLLVALVTALLFTSAPAAAAAKLGTRQIRIGSQGGDVKQLQRSLRALGYHISVDGAFGPQTDGAVRGYERSHHMTVDGTVGRREAAMILKDAALAMLKDTPPPTGGQGPPAQGGSNPPPSDPPPPPPPPPPPASVHAFPVDGPFSFGVPGAPFGA